MTLEGRWARALHYFLLRWYRTLASPATVVQPQSGFGNLSCGTKDKAQIPNADIGSCARNFPPSQSESNRRLGRWIWQSPLGSDQTEDRVPSRSVSRLPMTPVIAGEVRPYDCSWLVNLVLSGPIGWTWTRAGNFSLPRVSTTWGSARD